MLLMDPVARASASFGDAPLLKSRQGTLSYRQCDTAAGRIAATLRKHGLKRGDIVAILSLGTPELILLLLALLKGGFTAAPLNHRFPESLQRLIINNLSPALLITAIPSPFETEKALQLSRILQEAEGSGIYPDEEGVGEDTTDIAATIMHTSASTGNPKAVVHTAENHWYSALGANSNLPFREGDTWLLTLPLFHVGGYAILFRALASGGAIAVDKPGTSIAHSVRTFRVTHLSIVATQLYRLLMATEMATETAALQGIKAILLGGSAIPAGLVTEAAERGLPIWLSYGSTEMGSQISTTEGPVTSLPPHSGRLLQWREATLSKGGELLVRGKCLCKGYLQGGRILPVTDSQGWFHTTDAGTIDEEGHISVAGRLDAMFIAGGENIHPEEIENALMRVEGILEAVVVPIPDPEYGQRPAAFIRTAAVAQAPDDAAITESMRTLVGTLKTPVRYFRVCQWATLPGSEKIDRLWYRQMAKTFRGEEPDILLPA